MRIAIFKDTLIIKGGGSRAVIELANALGADIVTCGYNKSINDWIKINGKVIDIGNSLAKYNFSLSYLIEVPLRYFLYREDLKYDINIFTGNYSIFNNSQSKYKAWYCFSPNRMLYDLKTDTLKRAEGIKKLFIFIYILFLTILDKVQIKKFNNIIAQNKNIQSRIKKYYGLDSKIIPTAINSTKYYFEKNGNFFLVVSRLQPEKRIDIVVDAFRNLPKENLIIVGDGPCKNILMSQIMKYPNIKLYSNISDEELNKLYARCRATIYMPKDEDFGLVPLESMASGKICIAANEGGCLETIVGKKTGFLIEANTTSLTNTIISLSNKNLFHFKRACLIQAKKYDYKNSVRKWKSLFAENYQ